ncbi:addiction module toxin, HicA family [Methylobacterium sp. J-030]|uniref:addiction module toxin, HicA family n=1 Tax=Methylobacterium sp. J-030 TaxID=2836627 RepID=UPI001FBC11F9|nr:addiction module toxin, HicA family [Methylobacterium sp. J-030]MCJ2069887.1 addiction module toxin, HicA family [Methylobacterium sp. J-030]
MARSGCTFEPGKGGDLIVRRAGLTSVLRQQGDAKERGTGLWRKIPKGLEIKDEG